MPHPSPSTRLPDVTWLTFDIIGTVFDVYTSLSSGVAALSAAHGVPLDPHRTARDWIAGYATKVADITQHGLPFLPPDQLLKNALADILTNAQCQPSPAARAALFRLWRTLIAWPDVASGLDRLGARFGLAILSNMSAPTQRALVRHACLPFQRLLSAQQVHAYKPAAVVYQSAVSRLGVAPQQIMMVAAHKYDLRAARAIGFRTAFIKRPLELGPTGHVDTASDPACDLNADGLDDLAAQLGL